MNWWVIVLRCDCCGNDRVLRRAYATVGAAEYARQAMPEVGGFSFDVATLAFAVADDVEGAAEFAEELGEGITTVGDTLPIVTLERS